MLASVHDLGVQLRWTGYQKSKENSEKTIDAKVKDLNLCLESERSTNAVCEGFKYRNQCRDLMA
jgi:hypothetical protein